jgi:hypothetical protein
MFIQSLLLVALIAFIGGSIHSATIQSSERNNHERDMLKKTWIARKEKLSSARFAWAAKVLIGKGSLVRPRGQDDEAQRRIPEEDASQDYKSGLLIAGTRVKYYSRNPMWSYNLKKFIDQDYKTNRLPDKHVEFFGDLGNAGLAQVHPLAIIRKPDELSPFVLSPQVRPLLLYMRPFEFENSRWEDWKIANSTTIADGRKCLTLERSHGANRERFYVDPERDYVVVRIENTSVNQVIFKEDISYKADKDFGWVPLTWSSTMYKRANGDVREATRGILLEYGFNKEIPAKEFDLELPEGTEVQDDRSGERYIVTKAKSKRLITADELRHKITYDQLLNSKSGEAGRERAD